MIILPAAADPPARDAGSPFIGAGVDAGAAFLFVPAESSLSQGSPQAVACVSAGFGYSFGSGYSIGISYSSGVSVSVTAPGMTAVPRNFFSHNVSFSAARSFAIETPGALFNAVSIETELGLAFTRFLFTEIWSIFPDFSAALTFERKLTDTFSLWAGPSIGFEFRRDPGFAIRPGFRAVLRVQLIP